LIHKNIIIARNFNLLNKQYIIDFTKSGTGSHRGTISQIIEKFDKPENKMTIDIYPLLFQFPKAEKATLLTLIIASLLNKTDFWQKNTTLRALSLVELREDVFAENRKLRSLLQQNSIVGETNIIAISDYLDKHNQQAIGELAKLPKRVRYEHINKILQTYTTSSTGVIFLPLEPPVENEDSIEYLENLDILTKNLPPVLLVNGALNILYD